MILLTVGIVLWLFFGAIAGEIAYRKGRGGGCGWLILGLLFGPITILAAAMISPDYRVLDERAAAKRQRQIENAIPLPSAIDNRLKIFVLAMVPIILLLIATHNSGSSDVGLTNTNGVT